MINVTHQPFLGQLAICAEFAQRIPNQNYSDVGFEIYDDHYFITIKVYANNHTYFISTGFWDNFDCRVEILEDGQRKNHIEFTHGKDLRCTLTQALQRINNDT